MNRAGTPAPAAQRRACHSGEKLANGWYTARLASSTPCVSSATGGVMSASSTAATRPSASGGPSISTQSGFKASNAASRLRAQPGPWCRTPK